MSNSCAWMGPAAGMNTPSMKMPTLGSNPGLAPDEPMPRMSTCVVPLLFAGAICKPGTKRATSTKLLTPIRSSAAPL